MNTEKFFEKEIWIVRESQIKDKSWFWKNMEKFNELCLPQLPAFRDQVGMNRVVESQALRGELAELSVSIIISAIFYRRSK